MRATILGVWALVLFVGVPGVIRDARAILESQPPGVTRNAALRDLVAETVVNLVALPFIALSIFGYGVFPRNNAAVTGGPWFVSAWRSRRPHV